MSRQEGHWISDLTPRSHALDRLALGLRAGGPLHRGHLELLGTWAYRGPRPGPPACSVRGRGSAPADACGASQLSHGRQGCMEEPGGLGFGAAAGLRGRCTGADSDTPGLESGCLGKRRKQSPRCAPSKPVTAESSVWTGGQGAHFWPGLRVSGSQGAGPGQPRGGAAVGGNRLLLPCSCRPASACSGLSWGGDAALGWTLVIFMDQTLGKHSGQLPLGVAFLSCLAAP